jgi:hypothetical protein
MLCIHRQILLHKLKEEQMGVACGTHGRKKKGRHKAFFGGGA